MDVVEMKSRWDPLIPIGARSFENSMSVEGMVDGAASL
jgi:hypothetical protein